MATMHPELISWDDEEDGFLESVESLKAVGAAGRGALPLRLPRAGCRA